MSDHHESSVFVPPKLTDQALLALSVHIENLLVAKNLRGMKQVQPALVPGYLLRAAQFVSDCLASSSLYPPNARSSNLNVANHTAKHPAKPVCFIGTGFPVANTFETDGPVGAIALYDSLTALGFDCYLVCADPLHEALKQRYHTLPLPISDSENTDSLTFSASLLDRYQPNLILSIERPGKAADGRYYNMRKQDISQQCACFDDLMNLAQCPTIAIGDGGNEIGMGNIQSEIAQLDIIPAVTLATELIIADVSNWGALGLIALIDAVTEHQTLKHINTLETLKFLSQQGSVDGITRNNTLTEDGLDAEHGLALQQGILDALNRAYTQPLHSHHSGRPL